MAGSFKAVSLLSSLPVDLTLALAVLSAVAVTLRFVTAAAVPRTLYVVVAAWALLIPAAFAVSATEYGVDKVERLLTLTFLCMLAPVVLVRSTTDVERLLWAWTGVCGLLVVSALVNPRSDGDYAGAQVTTESVDTIGLGVGAGLVVVVTLVALTWRRLPWYVALPAAGCSLYVLLGSGSRAPLISTLAAVALSTVATRRRPRAARVGVVLVLMAVGVAAAFAAAPLYSRARILDLAEGGTTGSVDTRVDLYDIAWNSILSRPLGLGWGGYEVVTFLGYRHPHDLPLEVLVEAGVVFGGLFLLAIVAALVATWRATTDFAGAAAAGVVTLMLGTALSSGDLNDNRAFFYALGIGLAAAGVGAARRQPDGGAATTPATAQRSAAASAISPAVTHRSPASRSAQ